MNLDLQGSDHWRVRVESAAGSRQIGSSLDLALDI